MDIKDSENIVSDEELESELEGIEKSEGEGDAIVQQIQIDMIKHEMSLFEALIGNDIYEVMNEAEGDESEDSKSGKNKAVLGKIIEVGKSALQKIIASITSLIDSFIIKASELMNGSNTKIVEKYKEKIKKGNYSKFKYQWSSFRGGGDKVFDTDKYMAGTNKIIKELGEEVDQLKKGVSKNHEILQNSVTDETKRNTVIETVFGVHIKDPSKIQKTVKTHLFEDRKENTGISIKLIEDIEEFLTDSSEITKSFKEARSTLLKLTRTVALTYNIMSPIVAKNGSGSDEQNEYFAKAINKAASDHRTTASGISTSIGIILSLFKFKIKECRTVYLQAASYTGAPSSNDQDKANVEEAVISQQIDDLFEGIYA